MLYRKFALAVGVLALVLVPSVVRAEFMTITIQEINQTTGNVSASATFTDTTVNDNPSATTVTAAEYQNGYTETQNGVQVQYLETGGIYQMQTNAGLSGFKVGDFTINITGSTSNSPGTASQSNLDTVSLNVKTGSSFSYAGSTPNAELLITTSSGDYTLPTGNAILTQTGGFTDTAGTFANPSSTTHLDLTNSNYAGSVNVVGSAPSLLSISAPDTTTTSNIPPNGNFSTSTPVTVTSTYSMVNQEIGYIGENGNVTFEPFMSVSAPEPSTMVLAFLGLSCVGGQRLLSRRKKQAVAV